VAAGKQEFVLSGMCMSSQTESERQLGSSEYVAIVAEIGARNVPPGGEDALAKALSLVGTQPRKIADIGCNTGWSTCRMALAFPDAEVFGFDISPKMIQTAKRRLASEPNATDPPTNNVVFECLDCRHLHTTLSSADLILSAGSSIFMSNHLDVFRAVAESLSEDGCFLDLHYLYFSEVPTALADAESRMFGLTKGHRRTADWLADYEDAGLALSAFRLLDAFTLDDPPAMAVIEPILRGTPGLEAYVESIRACRSVANRLSQYRRPAIFKLIASLPAVMQTASSDEDLATCMKVLDLFSAPVPRYPMDVIRRLNPYEFLAYVGDPDAAPGGAKSVRRLCDILRGLGMSEEARVLDVGSFTGLSSIVLMSSFKNTIGMDINPEFVRIATAIAKGLGYAPQFETADATQTGYKAQSFDCVVMTATLGYSPEPKALIGEAHRLLRDDGYFVEFLYHYDHCDPKAQEWLRHAVSPYINTLRLSEQVRLIEAEGFQLLYADPVPSHQIPTERGKIVHDLLVEREKRTNPHLQQTEINEFEILLRTYLGPDQPMPFTPVAYCCVFRRLAG
jgi:SAM-dependent methyltransferase